MLSKKEPKRSFNNGPLRDQWEQKAQSVADQCKQEAEWKKKSSIKLSFSKWNYHWSLVSNGDFKKLTSDADEAEKNKQKIKFKVVPPPPKAKREPAAPPPPPKKAASPKLHRQKRKVEVDVFGLCWKDSWMSLKPPKYLYLKAKETKNKIPGFTTIELTNHREYKPKEYGSEPGGAFPADEWSDSWKQVKSPAQSERSEEKQLQWEILCQRKVLCKVCIEVFSLPVWAGTWKFMNFAFRQQKKDWDHIWPDYQYNLSNKLDKVEQLEEQEKPSDWEDSWKTSGADNEKPTGSETTVMTRINDVMMPAWTDSWLLSAAPLEEEEERLKSWSSCWAFRQQTRWCHASLQSHHRHSATLTKRRKDTNLLLTSQLDQEITRSTEWTEAWRTPKGWIGPEEDEMRRDTEEEEEVVDFEEDVEVDEEEDKDEGDEEVDNKEEKVAMKVNISGEEEDSVDTGEEEEEEEEEDDADKDQEKEVHIKEVDEDERVDEEEVTDKEDAEAEDMSFKKEEEDVCEDADKKEEEDYKGDNVKKRIKCKPSVPLHLQFHKLNASFSSWKQSWMVAVAHKGGDEYDDEEEEQEGEEVEEWKAWRESWRICRWKKPDEDEVLCFSTEHRSQRCSGVKHREDGRPKSEWSLSWKMAKTVAKDADTEEEEEEEEESGKF
ncbi:nestin-like [Cyclopterus lumpus]|uniref:nestin-like n=1 Tax=Cyclopterus lumpus TaxID=8103 RepID=UPI0014869D25|nr:nestin-like [Cyclopterus lumpus]